MGGEVVRKKQSDEERRWEVGESKEERMGEGEGEGEGKVGICCGLAVAPVVNHATGNKIAATPFLFRLHWPLFFLTWGNALIMMTITLLFTYNSILQLDI